MGVPQTIVPGGGQPELEVIGGARPDSFPLLDGARGLAALCVFCFHGWLVLRYSHMDQWAARAGETPMRGITSVIGASGPEAVAVFFSLSGFLLYRPFLAARMAGAQSPRIGRFAVRRAARILPAYWFALVVLGLLGRGTGVFTVHGIRDYFLFGQIYSGKGSTWNNPVEPAWTICVEVSFYLFLPFWALFTARVTRGRANPIRLEVLLTLGLILASIGWKAWAVKHTTIHEAHQPLLVALPATLDMFGAGFLLALLSVGKPRTPWQHAAGRFFGGPGVCVGLALVGYALLCLVTAPAGPFSPTWPVIALAGAVLKVPVAALLIVPGVVLMRGGGSLGAVYRVKRIAWVGVVSYGFYIWHIALLRWLNELIGRGTLSLGVLPFVVAGVMLVALAMAAASWYWLERPILRLAHTYKAAKPQKAKVSV
ncbi:MAG: acyltransferase [Solirubrobacterales bacterium]|nr:acyltransferase [Solirubrobacterales bacterium]